MDSQELKRLLLEVSTGNVSTEAALDRLLSGPFRQTALEFANLDHHRGLRHGVGEVVYGEGKTVEQILSITENLALPGKPILITRLNPEKLAALSQKFPEGRANAVGRTFIVHPAKQKDASSGEPYVAVVAAGTSDAFVAEEAAEVCLALDVAFEKIYDVGVTGLHRLLPRVEVLQKAAALVVVAGMEGALPSVLSGLMARPLFAVPTSVGYGASFGGLTALLAMLNSCAPGVSVVNIDNGFSAAFAAANVARALAGERRRYER